MRAPHTAEFSHPFSETKAKDNEFGFGYVSYVSERTFGYVGPSPIQWRAKEHAKCMASNDFAQAEEWLDEIGRELKVARHDLAYAKSVVAEGGAK